MNTPYGSDLLAMFLDALAGHTKDIEEPDYQPPRYTLHACSRCGIYSAEHDTHVCSKNLLEWLKK